jgi:membrane protease YdiL (CAAX protease family)
LNAAFPALDLFDFPGIEMPWLRIFDPTLGLAFVAVTEELVGRRVTLPILRRHLRSSTGIVVVSPVMIALMHWSYGVGSFLVAGIAGAIFMAVYMRTGSLLAVITAHYLVDLIAFA